MKELSIEEKAKAYDKALDRAKEWLNIKEPFSDTCTCVVESIFPELKESEDERIRKELIEHIKANKEVSFVLFNMFSPDDVIAWLEKQGQVKESAISQHENQTCKENDDSLTRCKSVHEATNEEMVDNTNEVEPKFDVDDWIVRKDGKNFADGRKTVRITRFDGERYWFDSGTYLQPKDIRLWTIADAKAGDVLVNGSNIFIFHFISDKRVMGYCHVNTDDGRFYDDIGKIECFGLIDAVFIPATKAQRVLLFEKMHEAGYEWDEKKLKLKKIASDNAEQDRLPFIWHDAAKELPPKHDDDYSKEVLVHTLSGSRFMLKYNYSINRWTNSFRITHWAYLPEPPKTE